MGSIKKHNADLFFFGVVFLLHFFMVFSAIKQMRGTAFSRAVQSSSNNTNSGAR